ncbi:MAG: YcxB family protein [Planctomycetes bacterium]|nr:YcxB family protein [Planctomycetota bacterium]
MEAIVLEFVPSLSDHLHADRLEYAQGALSKVDKFVAVLLASTGVALLTTAGPRWWCFLPFPLAVLEWFDLLSIRPLQIRVFFLRNPKFRERYRLELSEDGIHFRTSTVDAHLAWSHYVQILESERVFLLGYGKRMYTVLPKRAFKDAAEIGRFRDLAQRKIGASGSAARTA